MHRQRGQVGIIGEHDLLHRRLGTRDFDDLGLVAQAPLHFRQELVRRDAERERDARPAAGHAADELLPFGAGGAEPHRLRVAFEHGRDIGEVDRRVPRFKLAGLRQAREETAQPEPLEIHGLGRLGAGRLHDLHSSNRFTVAVSSRATERSEGDPGPMVPGSARHSASQTRVNALMARRPG